MTGADLLLDAFGRAKDVVHDVLDGLDEAALATGLDPGANTIGWLIWHLTRIQDDHVAHVAETAQVYVAAGWWERLGRPFEVADHGYGHSVEQVGSLHIADPTVLLGYHDAVYDQTAQFVRKLTDADFDRVVDTAWDPPVTLAVRLVSVIADCLEHAGQAAYVKGSLSRARS